MTLTLKDMKDYITISIKKKKLVYKTAFLFL